MCCSYDETIPVTYTTAFSGVECSIDERSFTINGRAQHEGTIKDCVCPTNVSIEGNLNITAGTCTGELPIKLYNGFLSRAFFSQDFLVNLMIWFFAISIISVGIIAALRR